MPSDDGHTRRPWSEAPDPDDGLLALTDDEILFKLQSLPEDHQMDEALLQVVTSDRHFFVRQEAAKRLRDQGPLREHAGDRHLGQILVRGMTRREDIAYIERLLTESRHVEVRKAAEVQLRILQKAHRDGED
jgi:hypothetical protein